MTTRLLVTLLILTFSASLFAQEKIAEARKKIGQTITVKGLVTNGDELGAIRYLQDETGGIAAYSFAMLQNVKKGDSIIVSGTLKNYNNLLEIDPVASVNVLSSNHPEPEPVVLSPKQIGERYESMLVKIKKAQFVNAGAPFEGNKNYNFTANGETGLIRINKSTTSIVGQIVPTGEVDLVVLCSQYSFNQDDTLTGYQLLPRSMSDFIVESAIVLTSPVSLSNIQKNGFKLSWQTNISGSTELLYGLSPENLDKKVQGTQNNIDGSFSHAVELKDLEPASIVYVEAISVAEKDTASSSVRVFATQSASSGSMKAYFNTPVDHSVSKGSNAEYLNRAIDDTLVAYIERAKESIDFTIYNFNNNNISNISAALNAAHKRGVKVRIITCGTANNLGQKDLDADVPKMESPAVRDGIMHNKFIVFDAHSADPDVPLVWTGATNFTDGQINTDPNNVIIIQDQTLAKAYELEFNEMWGSETLVPDPSKALYGAFKKDNTPHEFVIGGKKVECYFSPSDGTNQKLIDAITSADNDLSIASMLITRSDLAYAIRDSKAKGVAVNILTNNKGDNTDLVNSILTEALGVQHFVFNGFVEGIMHHKYAVIDQDKPGSDPILITGSHNWSASANDRNDENTLIIHDATIANIYYQQFVWNFLANHGSFTDLIDKPIAANDTVFVEKDGSVVVDVLANDQISSAIDLTIEQAGYHGTAFIPFTNPNQIQYQPQLGFIGSDTILYKISYQSDATLFGTARIIVKVGNVGVSDHQNLVVAVMPNPFRSDIQLRCLAPCNDLKIVDLHGRTVFQSQAPVKANQKIDLSNLQNGVYLLMAGDRLIQKIVKIE